MVTGNTEKTKNLFLFEDALQITECLIYVKLLTRKLTLSD